MMFMSRHGGGRTLRAFAIVSALAVVAGGLALAVRAEAATPAVVAQAAFASDRLSVEVVGQGPDVILIPGLASSREVWRAEATRNPMGFYNDNSPYRVFSMKHTYFEDYFTQTGDPRVPWTLLAGYPAAGSKLTGYVGAKVVAQVDGAPELAMRGLWWSATLGVGLVQ